ncbi:MAG: UvrD-helicase domain-containing protein [Candidatus Magasanikbacteria bacterium]|nr:UvrD-helicase domain-containing protein [Candidatus Magasanikbacteria bacterium]
MPKYPLNKAQKEAVEYTNGPLLIVAGAGTGKTTVITQKICHLIENKLAKPEEILALAFNDKAAEEIQERVDELLDIGYTEIAISTFHSFCQRILERHAIDIGLSNQFELLSQTGAWLLVRKNLDKLNLDYYRPVGNPTKHIHELLKHFSKCKDELISPEDYLQYAEGLSKDNGTVNLEDKNRTTELANVYHAYNQLLLDSAHFDFGDLIYYVNKLFQTRPNVLASFQARYKYILVDEFQDVNWSQYNLVQMLADAKAQLTVVGDDDQSIYAFRGASVSNILRFQDDFPKAKKIVLNENYRSNQEILDKAYESVQNNNPDRLEVKLKIDKKLVSTKKTVILSEAKNPSNKKRRDPSAAPQDDKSVVHMHSATLEDEVKSVVDEIERLKQIDADATWDNFAILVRANSHAEPFIAGLDQRGIPYEFLAASGLYRQPVILDCINYFKLLTDHADGIAIFRLLRLPFLTFSENDLQKFTSQAKRKACTYYEALKRCREFNLSEESVRACDFIVSLIHDGLKDSRYLKPTILLYNFLKKSGYLKYLKEQEETGNAAVIRQNFQLKQFFDYIETFEKITPDAHISNFMEEFGNIQDSGDRGKIFDFNDTPDSVNILTVHGAKGLEYKYVFIVNLVEERFPTRTKGDAIEIPLALVKEQLPEGDSHYEEERRLFYVAMTRAKERLYFTSALSYGGTRAKKISRFLDEIGYRASEDEGAKQRLAEKRAAKAPEKHEIVYELPKSFSFSHIQMYETCPYKYKLAHVLSLPAKGSHYFSFGTTIHNTLQAFYLRVKELNATEQVSLFEAPKKKNSDGTIQAPTVDELLKIYETKWIDDWYMGAKQKAEYFEKGKKVLRTFYKSQENNWTIPEFLESFFKIKIGDHLLSGRIDRVDKLPDGSLEIIDYKTGKPKEKLATNDKEQLLIYQIAAEQLPEYKNVGKPSKLTYYYLEDEIHTSFIGDNKDLEKLQESIAGSIDKIKAQKFDATPSQFVCEHCDFRDICEFRV